MNRTNYRIGQLSTRSPRMGSLGLVVLLISATFWTHVTSAGSIWTDTTDTDFDGGTVNGTMVNGNGTAASVELEFANICEDWRCASWGNPPPVWDSAMVYDEKNRVVVMFGGGTAEMPHFLSQTWIYRTNSSTWTNMNPAAPPVGRDNHAMAYDSANGAVVLFGGQSYGGPEYCNETWVYNLSRNTWTEMKPENPPPGRYDHAMVYDEEGRKVVLFGGKVVGGIGWHIVNDTWTYDLGTNTWTNQSPPDAPRTSGRAMVYDSYNKVSLLCAGYDIYHNKDNTWKYDLGQNKWTDLNPPNSPTPGGSFATCYDSENRVVVLFGGTKEDTYANDTWTYDPAANNWSIKATVDAPSIRAFHAMAYDAHNKVAVMFGGRGKSDNHEPEDTWSYDARANAWTNRSFLPRSRSNCEMVFDSGNNVVILFGARYLDRNETWVFNVSSNSWRSASPPVAPSSRFGEAMAYDSDSRVVVLFGGTADGMYENDTWVYDYSANLWKLMDPPVSPPPRHSHAMAYDGLNKVMVLFGGDNVNDSSLNDTWTYGVKNNSWVRLEASDSPSGLKDCMMVYDSEDDIFVLVGKRPPYPAKAETWIFESGPNRWANVTRDNTPPLSDGPPDMAYDSANDLAVMFCGGNETWTYDSQTNNWTRRNPSTVPPGRYWHAIAYDSLNRVVVMFGGTDGVNKGDTWLYSLDIRHSSFGTFISQPVDAGGPACFGTLNCGAKTNLGTSLRLQFRTAGTRDGLSVTDFAGPDGTGATWYDGPSQKLWSGHNGSRWMQYRAFLSTGDDELTPALNEVQIEYNLIHEVSLIQPSGGENWTVDWEQEIVWRASDRDNDTLTFDIFLTDGERSIPIASNLREVNRLRLNISAFPSGRYRMVIVANDSCPAIPVSVNASSGFITIYRPAPNRPPRITSQPATNATVGMDYFYEVKATDEDDDVLNFTIQSSIAGMSMNATTGRISWRPEASQAGAHAVTVIVSDGKGGAAGQSFVVNVANPPKSHLETGSPQWLLLILTTVIILGMLISVGMVSRKKGHQ